jgi:hypothetical protein
MTSGALRKVGGAWTRQGWKRIPRRLQTVKLVPVPRKKRKAPKLRRINLASPRPETPIIVEAEKMAAGASEAVSAPTLAPKLEKPIPRQPRRAWSGKYAALTPLEAKNAV